MPVKRSALTETDRQKRLKKAITNSYWLGKEILGYDRLTDAFHKPIMREWDRRDRCRRLVSSGRERLRGKGISRAPEPLFWNDIRPPGMAWYDRDEFDNWPRDHYKTTCIIVRCAKLILMWPDVAISAWHAVEEKIQETAEELGKIFMENDAFRELMPDIMPSKRVKRWLTASGFTVRRSHFKRHKTFHAKGAKSEVTGGHSDIGWLDDVVAQGTIENSEMPLVRRWIGHTVRHVLRTDGGWLWCTGTRWAHDDIYADFLASKQWDSSVRAALETNGLPDYKGTPILYEKKWIKKKQDDPSTNFPNQMMNDPEPETERPWGKDCEHFTDLAKTKDSPGIDGPGAVFVLSDPAPYLEGGYKGLTEKKRGDGTKDYWSISVVKLRVRGPVLDIILLAGDCSQEWDHRAGADVCVKYMNEYSTRHWISENAKEHLSYMLEAALPVGVSLTRLKDGSPLKFADYNKADGKNSRCFSLATRARDRQFWVCKETVSDRFLYGDGQHTGFLTQARKFRKTGPNKNNLRFDDQMDNVARATDAALLQFTPRPHILERVKPMSPFRNHEANQEYTWGTKHVRA